MNKYLVYLVAVLALIGCCGANTDPQANKIIEEIEEQFTFAAANDGSAEEETMTNPEHLYFKDFCVQSQDVFKGFLQEKVGGTAAQIYNILLTSAGDVGSEVLKAQTEAASAGQKLIESNTSSDQTLAQKMGQALKMVFDSMLGTAQTQIFERLAALRKVYSLEMLRDQLEDVCLSISSDLQRRLDYKLRETTSSLKRSASRAPNGKELTMIAQKAKTDSVGCTLTGRISKVSKFCDVLKLAGPSIWAAIGLDQ